MIKPHELHLGTRQLAIGRQNVKAALSRMADSLLEARDAEQHLVDRTLQVALFDAAAHRAVALGGQGR